MISIVITPTVVGGTHMYEEIGRKGQRAIVPTFQAFLCDGSEEPHYQFRVTRLSADFVFGKKSIEDFGTNGECPPSKIGAPYHARLHRTDRLGTALMLYEPKFERESYLQGQGPIPRGGINIHLGPASSKGCFAVGGGKRGYKAFLSRLIKMIDQAPSSPIRVTVLPRQH